MQFSPKILTFCICWLFTSSAIADRFYPQYGPSRKYGTSQGDVGSCYAEAIVTAMENTLSQKGYHVMLSHFHLHNWVYRNKDYSEQIKSKLITNGVDKQILDEYGPIVPYYFLPEDGYGLTSSQNSFYHFSGIRPHVSEAGIYHTTFKKGYNYSTNKIKWLFPNLPKELA